MQPNTTQIIAGIVGTFETHIAPRLETKREQGMARSILALLDHVAVRAQHEGPLLAADVKDLRALFRELEILLTPAATQGALQPLLDAITGALQRQHRPADAYPDIASLTSESEELRRTLAATIDGLLSRRSDLPAEIVVRADEAIRALLARQLDREAVLMKPFMGKRIY